MNAQELSKRPSELCCPTLVVGGAGFIGSHTVEALLARGCQVRVLDDLSSGKAENLPLYDPGLDLMVGDMLDYHTVREAMHGMEWCIHLAAQGSAVRSIEDPFASALWNILGFINVLEAAREARLQRVVYASSAAVYGESGSLPLTEGTAPCPLSPFGLEKWVDEAYAELYNRMYGLRLLGLRYFNVYGPRQDPKSPHSGVISKFIERLGAGRPPVVYGDGRQTRDFIHVKDVAQVNLAALASDHCGVCNVATGQRVDLLRLIRILSDCLETQVEPEFVPARASDLRHSCGSDRRMRDLLKLAANRSLEDGLAALVRQRIARKASNRTDADGNKRQASKSSGNGHAARY